MYDCVADTRLSDMIPANNILNRDILASCIGFGAVKRSDSHLVVRVAERTAGLSIVSTSDDESLSIDMAASLNVVDMRDSRDPTMAPPYRVCTWDQIPAGLVAEIDTVFTRVQGASL